MDVVNLFLVDTKQHVLHHYQPCLCLFLWLPVGSNLSILSMLIKVLWCHDKNVGEFTLLSPSKYFSWIVKVFRQPFQRYFTNISLTRLLVSNNDCTFVHIQTCSIDADASIAAFKQLLVSIFCGFLSLQSKKYTRHFFFALLPYSCVTLEIFITMTIVSFWNSRTYILFKSWVFKISQIKMVWTKQPVMTQIYIL